MLDKQTKEELMKLPKEEIVEVYEVLYELYDELGDRVGKAIEIIDLIKPELWNISNKMTYRLLDIKNILKGSDK